jgi:UDP-glucose 4-epimerase
MRILISGGAGFIGSHLADRLISRGDEVMVIDNYATGRRDNLTPNPGLSIVEGPLPTRQLLIKHLTPFNPTWLFMLPLLIRIPTTGLKMRGLTWWVRPTWLRLP